MVISALVVAMVLAGLGVGMGTASAEPDGSGDDQSNSETDPGTPPGNVEEPIPPVTPTSIPRSLPEQIRDLIRRPFSVFGNGRSPGQPAAPRKPALPNGAPNPESADPTTEGTAEEAPSRKRKDPPAEPEVKVPEPPEPTVRAATPTAEVRLPFTQPFSVPLPTVPGVRGADQLRLSIDLTSPQAAYSTVEQTLNTVNSLLADAYAPYNPFQPPTPEPEPTFRITEEAPVIGAGGSVTPMGDAGGGIAASVPVLPLPMAPPRIPPPARGSIAPARPAGAPPLVLGGGSAGVPTPALRGSIAPTGTIRTGGTPGGGTAPAGNPALRQGYSQYLRAARPGELALVALPGLVGLLAITASGGVIGYRQANSTRFLRENAERFVR